MKYILSISILLCSCKSVYKTPYNDHYGVGWHQLSITPSLSSITINNATLNGSVKDVFFRKLSGSFYVLKQENKLVAKNRVNSDGLFELSIKPGRYCIEFYDAMHQMYGIKVFDIEKGDTITIEVHLVPTTDY